MRFFKYIDTIPERPMINGVEGEFKNGDEIKVRKGSPGSYRFEVFKVASDGSFSPSSITAVEWDKLSQMTQGEITKLLGLKTQSEIDQSITDATWATITESIPAIQGGATAATATVLPTLGSSNKWFDASAGFWKYNNVVLKNPNGVEGIPVGSDGQLYWNGTTQTWSISKVQALPQTEILNSFGNSKVAAISQGKVSEISETLEYSNTLVTTGEDNVSECIANFNFSTDIVANFIDAPLDKGIHEINVNIVDVSKGNMLLLCEFNKNEEGLYNRVPKPSVAVVLGVNTITVEVLEDGNRLGYVQRNDTPVVGRSYDTVSKDYVLKGRSSAPTSYASYSISNFRVGFNIKGLKNTFKLVDNLKEGYDKSKNEYNELLENNLSTINGSFFVAAPIYHFIINIPSINGMWVKELNIVTKGKLLLEEFQIDANSRVSRVRGVEFNFEEVGIHKIDFEVGKGNYFGWGFTTGMTGRIGMLNTSAGYTHLRSTSSNFPVVINGRQSDYRFAVSLVEENSYNSYALSKRVYDIDDKVDYVLTKPIKGYVKFVKKLGVRFDHVHLVRYNNMLILIGQYFENSIEDYQKSKITALISRDGGKTWKEQIDKNFSTFSGSVNVFAESNADVYQLDNGNIFILFVQSKVGDIQNRALLSCTFNVDTLSFYDEKYIVSDYKLNYRPGGNGGVKISNDEIIFPIYRTINPGESSTTLIAHSDLLVSYDGG